MDLIKAIKTRRSVRFFLDEKIPKDKLNKIVGSANWAPSACNIQGWRFIVIDNQKIINKIIEMDAAYLLNKPHTGILVLYDNRTDNLEYKDNIQSAAAAIQNMLLTAHSLNIGSCWVCHLPTKKQLKKLLKIPWNYDPIAYIALGYYTEKSKESPRKYKIEQLVSYNFFNFNEQTPSVLSLRLRSKRVLRKIYYLLPIAIKKILKPITKKIEKKF